RAGRVPRVALVADELALLDHAAGVEAARVARLQVGVPRLHRIAVGDDHDPGRVGAVRVVPADVDDGAVAGRTDGRAVRGDDVDALVEMRAVAQRRLPREPGAPEVLRHVPVHRPFQLAVVGRGDVPPLHLVADQLVDLVAQLGLGGGGLLERL